MSNADKLKRKAAEFEQKKQYDRALELYVQVLDKDEGSAEERDVPLYNRVGDLHLRLGNTEKAVTYYEKAVDLYADSGYLNNAIALCNKILRHSPGRTTIYHKLGRISAKKGFNSDAKQNFLEYADRMQKQGKMDEAFAALQEFADLCPGQDDIRLLLAEQLSRAGRKPEALEQLQILHEALDAEGRESEAAATLERMKAIDPTITPRRAMTPRSDKAGGLVFLDLDEKPRPAIAPVKGLEQTAITDEAATAAVVAASPPAELVGLEPTAIQQPGDPLAGLPVVPDEPPPAKGKRKTPVKGRPASKTPVKSAPAVKTPAEAVPAAKHRPDDDYVNLADWLNEDEGGRSTRMVASDERRALEGQADFEQMLEKFKQGVAANVDDEDAESHYDLGIAYREMGLIDEAIAEFQTALRGTANRIRTFESLGQCFIDKLDYDVAQNVLTRALNEPEAEDAELVGVLYLLGIASEKLQRWADASAYYQRVVAVDIDFRDVSQRIAEVGRNGK
jgi:tetratricopeptide (TPR) repeat protein